MPRSALMQALLIASLTALASFCALQASAAQPAAPRRYSIVAQSNKATAATGRRPLSQRIAASNLPVVIPGKKDCGPNGCRAPTASLPVVHPPMAQEMPSEDLPSVEPPSQSNTISESAPVTPPNDPAPAAIEPAKDVAQVVSEPAQVVTEPAQVVTEPAQVVTEPAQVVTEPAKVVTEPAKVVTEPDKKVAELVAESEKKVAELVAESEKKVAMLVAESEKKVARLVAEPEEKVAKLVADSEKKVAKLVADSKKKVAKMVAEPNKKVATPVAKAAETAATAAATAGSPARLAATAVKNNPDAELNAATDSLLQRVKASLAAKQQQPGVEETRPASTIKQPEVNTPARLEFDVQESRSLVKEGEQIVMRLAVRNVGGAPASEVNATLFFAEGIEPVRAIGHTADVYPGEVRFGTLREIPAGDSIDLLVTAIGTRPGSVSYRGEIECSQLSGRIAREGAVTVSPRKPGAE